MLETGQGGFGNVYLVFSEELNIVAAKVMKESQEGKNPFVLKYHSANMNGENVLILMDLQDLIEEKKDLPLSIIRVIMKQLLEGLRLMHEKGLIHRDIKGDNVMFHSPIGSGRIILKITDFGLVKVQKKADQTTRMSIAGTAAFLPPEMLIGNDDEDGQMEIKADAKVRI
ncbi:MAG: hypothetical protein EZS28_031839 [Streblomastix strix]|uniref:Protein kinase domain-containing protein n=1 Tax=Streblomastix strix TaxID=222440 RepID=A0A5J4US49_9EUKA|nr:MAG: hypothetical protein EZS28_031839 [Streblomastix strix]